MAEILALKHVTKVFPGVRALDDVSYSLEEGEVSALLGENGAGKSTLIKIISGVYEPTEGDICWKGEKVRIKTAADAQKLGIGTIHQEFNLFQNLTVMENIAFCSNLNPFSPKVLNLKAIKKKARAVLDSMMISLPLDSKIKYLSVANQQLVEIAKALMLDVKVLIMDEPTAALTDLEIDNLFRVLERLKKNGVSIIYISHRMNEIMNIAEKITVLRDGKMICSDRIENLDETKIAQMITGKTEYLSIEEKLREQKRFADVKLKVENLTLNPYYKDISFEVNKGMIFGLLGPLGAGKTEIGTTIYGIRKQQKGKIWLDGSEVHIKSPSDALKRKIAYISEDRKRTGLLPNMSVKVNITISELMQISRTGVINSARQSKRADEYVDMLRIKTPHTDQNINYLSGGNQQKALVGRCLAVDPEVLILDQPTRGLDIGAKEEIRKLLHSLADGGMSIIVLTMEVPEALELCDKISVLKEGRIVTTVLPSQTTPEGLTDIMLSH